MPVIPNSNNGIFNSNLDRNRVTSIVTPAELKNSYLFGITLNTVNGEEFPEETIQMFIDNAVSNLEHQLDIAITPKHVIENQDFNLNQYADWGFLSFQNFPVLQINKVRVIYLRNNEQEPESFREIPNSWFRLEAYSGIVRLIPNSRFTSFFQIGQGQYFPQIMRSPHVPSLWELDYVAGFDHGKVPILVNQAISLLAAVQTLMVAGNLLIGAGIASQSLSIDSLSQSITTTASAENSAYSATIREYQRLLYGTREGDENSIIKKLQAYYKGVPVSVI